MAKRLAGLTLSFTLAFSAGQTNATPLEDAKRHAEIGLAAAEHYPGYASLCDLVVSIRNVNVPRDGSARKKTAREGGSGKKQRSSGSSRAGLAPLPPLQVFNNLYFLGTRSVAAWLYGTEDGYLLIDGLNTDEEAKKYIFGGMESLGLSPDAIKYVLVTHGHGDHYGGADYVAETLGIDVLMTKEDWDLVETIGTHPRFGPPPKRGGTVVDGQTLRFGTSELTVHTSPGHTPGTVSPIFSVRDGQVQHSAMLWGGTGFNFGPKYETFMTYAASARKMRDASQTAGVDVFLSGHPRRDNSEDLMAALSKRVPGTPHPFVKGDDGYDLFTVLEHCALAQAARFVEKP